MRADDGRRKERSEYREREHDVRAAAASSCGGLTHDGGDVKSSQVSQLSLGQAALGGSHYRGRGVNRNSFSKQTF